MKNLAKKVMLGTAFTLAASTSYASTYVYISNADDGDITSYELISQGAPQLKPLGSTPAAKFVMPMAVSKDGKLLYASVRSKPFALYTYKVDQANGKLDWQGATPMPDSMVYIAIDQSGKWLLSTSYGGHKNSVNQIKADGSVVAQPAQLFASGGKNPHSINFDKTDRFVYIPQLGTDEIKIHTFNAKSAKPLSENSASVSLGKNIGPRHMVISPDNKFAYVIAEMVGKVFVYERDVKTGMLTEIQSIESLPADSLLVPGRPRPPTGSTEATNFDDSNMIQSAEIKITPNGKFLYTSERTHSSLTGFKVDQLTGRLEYLSNTKTEEMPRGFGIDPSGQFLVATGQKSDKVSLYSINQGTGALSLVERIPGGKGANWVTFIKAK
jgi:6-phosphogluconolactonase